MGSLCNGMFAPVSLLFGQGGGRWLEGTAGEGTEASPALLKANAGVQEDGLLPGYLWPIQ